DARARNLLLQTFPQIAQDLAAAGGNLFRLRRACVRAENFSCAGLDEYRSAKMCLESARASDLETKARRILYAHGVPVDPRCNVRLDSASGPRLLLGGVPDDAAPSGGEFGGGAFLGQVPSSAASFGVSRRLALPSAGEGAEEAHPPGAAAGLGVGGEAGGGGGGDVSVVGRPSAGHRADGAISAAAAGAAGAALTGEWGARLFQRQVQELVAVRRDAERDFLACVTALEEDHGRACDRDYAEFLAQDAEETHRKEYMAMLDARGAREEERLDIEKRRLLEESRRHEEEEAERRRRQDAARLRELWASDHEFFRLLSLANLALASAAAGFKKGFSLAPGAILDAAWRLTVAEC
ncbi:unnamed protein product, partial [Hapterophycus canaliculatus]